MADTLDDDFYFSEEEDSIQEPNEILRGEPGSGSDVEADVTEQPVAGHAIHPDRMSIPTLKRHVDEITLHSTLKNVEPVSKKLKKFRPEEPIPVTPQEQLDYLLKAYAKYKKPTAFEMDNIKNLSIDKIIDTSSLTESIQSAIQASIPNWEKVLSKKFNKHKGVPRVIILSASAVRCIDLVRQQLPHLHRIHPIAKLFAKHKKFLEHKEMVSKTVIRVAVGTPGRIMDLQKEEELDLLRECQIIVLDMVKDSKKRDILSIEECQKPVLDFLDTAMPYFQQGSLKLMFKF